MLKKYFKLGIKIFFLLLAFLPGLLTYAQHSPFKVAAKLYPVDLIHDQYNALHGGIEVYRRPFSLHLSYGGNAGIHLTKGHESYQKGHKYKAGIRYYLSFKDTAGTQLPSTFVQVLYSRLDYTQQRQKDHYTDLSGMEWHYETTQLQTTRSGVEAMVGKNVVICQRLMAEGGIGLFLGHMTNNYSKQSGMGEYTPPADNLMWFLPSNTKYRKEGRSFVARPAASIGLTYWLW